MSLIKKLLFTALLAPLLAGGVSFAAEFEVLDRFSVDGYTVLRGSADIPGGSFTVGGSTFVVRDGKVGIGTDSPGSLLSLYSAVANPVLKITDASGAGIRGALLSGSWGGNGAYLDSLASAGWVYLGSSPGGGQANQVVAYTAGAERIRIDSYGNVGIGTTGSGVPLEVSGTSNRNTAIMIVSSTGAFNGDGSDTTEKGLSVAASAVAVHGLLFNVKAGSNNLFTVGGNGKIGVGTAGSGANLHISSTTASSSQDMFKITTGTVNADVFVVKGSGKVGIGTTNPAVTLDLAGTDAIKIPVGTTAERPASPANGMMRINTTTGKLEYYYSGGWSSIGAVAATGGTITESDGYKIHTFTSGGTFTITNGGNVEVLVVAGGGGGGSGAAGGGGAGGLIYYSSYYVAPQAYTVTVGGGGAAGVNGQNSIFSTLTAFGGGYGSIANGGAGGSGGGGGYQGTLGGNGTSGQGNAGGRGYAATMYPSGGGGGAGAAGAAPIDGNYVTACNGGAGVQYPQFAGGSPAGWFSGGGGASGSSQGAAAGAGGNGGGGAGSVTGAAASGAANTGGGGGGTHSGTAAAGGSGIVIIRYSN